MGEGIVVSKKCGAQLLILLKQERTMKNEQI